MLLQYCNISNMKAFRKIIAFLFYVLFFIFSLSSLTAYYNGDIVYNLFNEIENKIVHFPSLTLCPSLEMNNLVNLKLNEIQKDFSMSFKSLETFLIFSNLKRSTNLTTIVENYSFSLSEMINIQHENRQNGNGVLRVDYNRLL